MITKFVSCIGLSQGRAHMQRVHRFEFELELSAACLKRLFHKKLVNRTLSLFAFLILPLFSQTSLYANEQEVCEQLLNFGQ